MKKIEFQKFFSITTTIFSRSRLEQFWYQDTKFDHFNKITTLLVDFSKLFSLLDSFPYLTNISSNHCEFCHREMLEFAFKKGLLFLKWLSLSRINIPGVFSFGYSSTVTQYTALLLQNGLRFILKSHTYSYTSCICHPTSKIKLKIIM